MKQAWPKPFDNGLQAAKRKLEHAGISTWSFYDLFTATRDQNSPSLTGKPLDLLHYPEMIADRYGVHAVEVVAAHLACTSGSYLLQFRLRLERADSRAANIPVDIPELEQAAGLPDIDDKVRPTAISSCKKCIDIAFAGGARSVRCDPGTLNISNLFPFASSVRHLKYPGLGAGASSLPFDFSRCMAASRRAGFKGIYSIEAEFGGDCYVSIQRLLNELAEHL